MKEKQKVRIEDRDKISVKVFTHIILGKNCKVEDWKANKIDQMTGLAAHIPWGLSHIGLSVEVVGPTMKPMEVAVHMKLLEVSEFVHWMVLQVVVLYK